MAKTLSDILEAAINKKPTDMEEAVNEILREKVTDLIEKRREVVAASVFSGEEAVEEEDDDDEEEVVDESTDSDDNDDDDDDDDKKKNKKKVNETVIDEGMATYSNRAHDHAIDYDKHDKSKEFARAFHKAHNEGDHSELKNYKKEKGFKAGEHFYTHKKTGESFKVHTRSGSYGSSKKEHTIHYDGVSTPV